MKNANVEQDKTSKTATTRNNKQTNKYINNCALFIAQNSNVGLRLDIYKIFALRLCAFVVTIRLNSFDLRIRSWGHEKAR